MTLADLISTMAPGHYRTMLELADKSGDEQTLRDAIESARAGVDGFGAVIDQMGVGLVWQQEVREAA